MKKALITGASEGIGRVFAQRLAREGYTITAVARNQSRLEALTKELGEGHDWLVADLSTPGGMKAAAGRIAESGYDLVVNNAGFGGYGKFHEVDVEKFESMLATNCQALMVLSHAFLKSAKKGDALINVSSTLAFLPFPPSPVYAATKAFVTSLSEALWKEQAPRGVFVMGLCPGITVTEFQKRAGSNQEFYPKGMTETPEDVVTTALAALRKRESPTVISGRGNRVLTTLTRLLPRKTVVSMMDKRPK